MATTEFIVDSYAVFHFSDKKQRISAMVWLLSKDKQSRSTLYFVRSAKLLGETSIVDGTNNSKAYYHLKRLREILDLLRNERPWTNISIVGTTFDGFTGLHGDGEPVGEGQG